MTPSARVGLRPISPEFRASAFYYTIFMPAGAAAAYAAIWFADMGITPSQIGVINALPIFLIMLFNLFVGRLADRASDWRQVIVIGALIAALVPFGLYFANDFWTVLLFWTLAVVPATAIGPVLDAASMRMTLRNGTDFGTLRAIGTLGYLTTIFLTGYVVVWFGTAAFLPIFLAASLLRGLVAFGLPRFRAPEVEGAPVPAAVGAVRLLEVMKPWFLLPLVGWSMVYATNLMLTFFLALVLKEQGVREDIIGLLIAAAAVSEAIVFFGVARFAKRFSARSLILFSALVAVVRWLGMALSPSVEWLFVLQMLQGITFALGYIGCVSFIANWTDESIAAQAQGVFHTLQQASSVIVIVSFGVVLGPLGSQGFLVSAGFAALGGALIWVSMLLQQPKRQSS